MKRTISGFVLVLMFGLGFGQEPLSLSKAIETGLSNNFDIRIASDATEIARNNNTWGTAGRWPSLGITIGSTNRSSNINNPASFITGNTVSIGGIGAVDLNWVLFEGMRVNISKRKLEQLQEQSEGNAALVIENSLQAIILAYYTAQLERERQALLQGNLDLSRDRYNIALTRRELGTGTTFDLLQDKNNYLADSSSILFQQVNVRNSIRNINLLIGEDVEKEWVLTDPLQVNPQIWDLEDLKKKSFSNNQSIKNQYINLELLQKDIDIARTGLFPRVSMNLGADYSSSWFNIVNYQPEPGRPALNLPVTGNTTNYYANFTLSYTLFNGGNIKRAIKNARVGQRIGQVTIQQMKHSISNQLSTSLALYNARVQLLSLTELTVENAKLSLELAEDRFKSGLINSFDFRDIQVAHLRSAFTRLEATYNLKNLETTLVRLTGGILEKKK